MDNPKLRRFWGEMAIAGKPEFFAEDLPEGTK
jgi:hypothetical protein